MNLELVQILDHSLNGGLYHRILYGRFSFQTLCGGLECKLRLTA